MLPEFPLIPASRGFCITLRKTLVTFKEVLIKENIIQRPSEWQNNENAEEITNNTNQCQETSTSVVSKAADCDSKSSNTQESNSIPTSSGNKSIVKEATTSSSSTNSCVTALSETKTSTLSQNVS